MTEFNIKFPDAKVSSLAHIDDDVKIGKSCIVEPFTTISNGAVIGNNCIIRSGARIGTLPFDFRISGDKVLRNDNFEHVILQDNVEIGHNSVVQSGVERNTIIGKSSVINNLCNIGHDIHTGICCTVGLSTSISGYTTLGDHVEISPSVTILNRVKIGNRTSIGIGSLVLHNFGDDTTALGRPAVAIDQYKHERKILKETIYGEYVPSKISTNNNKLNKVVKRIVRRFI